MSSYSPDGMLRLLGLASIGVAVALVRVGYSSFFRASRAPPEESDEGPAKPGLRGGLPPPVGVRAEDAGRPPAAARDDGVPKEEGPVSGSAILAEVKAPREQPVLAPQPGEFWSADVGVKPEPAAADRLPLPHLPASDGDDDPRLLAAAVASAAVAAAVAAGNSLAPPAAATATPPERPLEHDGAGVEAPSPAPGPQRVASAFEALRDPFDQSLSPDRRAVFLGGAGDDAYGGLAPSPYAAAASPPRSPVSGPAPFAGLASPSAADLGLPMLSIPRPTAKALEPSPDSEPDSAAASSPAFSEALEREASGYAADAGSGPGSEDLGAGGAMEGPHPPPFPGLRLSLPGDAPAGPLSLTPGASGEGFDFMPSEDDQFALEVGEEGEAEAGWPDWQAGAGGAGRGDASPAPRPAPADPAAASIPLFSALVFDAPGSLPRGPPGPAPPRGSGGGTPRPHALSGSAGSPSPSSTGGPRSSSAERPSPRIFDTAVAAPPPRLYDAAASLARRPPSPDAGGGLPPPTPRLSVGSYNPFELERGPSGASPGPPAPASPGRSPMLASPRHHGARLAGRPPPDPFGALVPAHLPPSAAAAAAAIAAAGHPPPRASLERLASNHSAAQLSRVLEDDEELWETFRVSMDVEAVLALKLDVLAGPCRDASYVTEDDTLEVTVGRTPGNSLALRDGEVSGRHLAVTWSSLDRCWQAADLGSLNGTLLNGEPISVGARQRGPDYRLSSDDILQLGSYTKIKVSTFPRDLLNPKDTHGSLPVGSLPKSLSMPKHRVMSFGSLTSPKPTANTPSRQPAATTACDELRMEACVLCRVGREHTRKGQPGEDVACAQCPLPDPGRLGEASVSLFCVFDGHCGRGAAEAAAVALPEEIGVRLPACEADMLEQRGAVSALRPAFLATDARIRAEEGCTATAVLAWSPRKGTVCLQAGNVGDSTALWIDPRTVEVVELTEDHRLSNERERRRLADMGIQLSKNSRRLYGLNLSRGLGDKFLKDEDLGLSAEPYVGPVVTCSASEGGLLLIASDGLWDVADFATVARVLCQSLRASGGDLVDGARAVLAHALKHRTKDDVSIVLARVLPEAEWEARSPPRSFSSGPIFGDP
ncbi:hypothetical protein ACKKBF_B39300 [Auxenochlorella protothecoides x Auxenochlorella symbiontica]